MLITSLAKLEREINNPQFIRISQSFLVNSYFITSIHKKQKTLLIGSLHHLPFTIPIKKLVALI